jgi:small-conductance mechanosensitive channel
MLPKIDELPVPLEPAQVLFVIKVMVVLAAIALAYKVVSRYLSTACKRLKIEKHVENAFRLILRIVTALIALTVLSDVFGLPVSWFIGGSALIGAAIGFGSSQTIGNLISGLYLIVTRPFNVNDYVKIGNIEGQVEEVSINYTTIYTPTYTMLKIPNVQVLNSRILNCTKGDLIDYTFTVNFSHDLSSEELIENCIQPAIDEFYEKHVNELPRKPECCLTTSDRLGKTFAIRMFFPKGRAKLLYDSQPALLRAVLDKWDAQRKAKSA